MEEVSVGATLTECMKRLLAINADIAQVSKALLAVGEAINADFERAVGAEVERRLSNTPTTTTQPNGISSDNVC